MQDQTGPDNRLTMDEAALAELARARDPEAWTAIYERHYRAIFRYMNARVFDRDVAADLASGVFTSAIAGIENYRYQGRPILAWLYRIARNSVADHHRRTLGRRGVERIGAPLRAIAGIFRNEPQAAASSISTWEPEEMAERLDLHRAVAQLPESQREVLILRFLVGLSTEEIGDVLGKERAAVYSLHARAITALRESLGGGKSAVRRNLPIPDENPQRGAIDIVRGKKS